MRYERPLNVILAVVSVAGLVIGAIGIYQQYHRRKFPGWMAYVLMLCWGIAIMTYSAKAILRGNYRTQSGRTISREQNRVQFWTSVGLASILGIVVTGIGAFKLITRLL